MTLPDALSAVLLALSLFFFTAGTIGLLRLPDLHSRLHALTKADNVGLGFGILAVMIRADSWTTVFKLALIWVLVLAAGASVCYLIASRVGPGEPAAPTRGENR
jgi:multicomponent Na+:H+ antiporter subunit G